MDRLPSTPLVSGFPRILLALFFAIFPLGVGLAVLVFLWFGHSDGLASPPLFFRLVGSLIGVAFVVFGVILITGVLAAGKLASNAIDRVRRAGARAAVSAALRECPRCGASPADAAVSSSAGEAKCQHCGAWFDARGKLSG